LAGYEITYYFFLKKIEWPHNKHFLFNTGKKSDLHLFVFYQRVMLFSILLHDCHSTGIT
jgi:hypothetical protein